MGSVADYRAYVSLIRKDGSSQQIASVSNDIYYYDNDDDDYDDEDDDYDDEDDDYDSNDEDDSESEGTNETEAEFVLTQEFINSLRAGDIIRLSGDGSCW